MINATKCQLTPEDRIRALEQVGTLIKCKNNNIKIAIVYWQNIVEHMPLEKSEESINNYLFANLVLEILMVIGQ